MQKKESIRPLLLNCDVAFSELKAHESPYIKGLSFDVGSNPVSIIGTNNQTGEGQNALVQKTIRSNIAVTDVLLPKGYNKHIGSFESVGTRELYHFNFNINGQHGIYVLSGDTGLWQKVVEDPELQFTDDQENYIANHRVLLRFVQDKNGDIIEKYLLITEGCTWQKYINVIAATKTNGFDTSLYPYWNLQPPHFDRKELLEWPVRPPMIAPTFEVIPNTIADKGKINRWIDKGIQVAYLFQYTDGRTTTVSPYSLPILIKTEDFLNNPDQIPKNVKLKLYAGSPLVEKILIYIRNAKKGVNTLPSISEWGDWYLYDTIRKFPITDATDVLDTDYWLRINPWTDYEYDNIFNTVSYVVDLSKVQQIVPDQDQANALQTGMPQLSVALTDLGDAALLADNRYGYPNFGNDVMDALSVEVVEKEQEGCDIPLRKIRLYAYIGRMGDDFTWLSQVGYYMGDDKQMRFGGLKYDYDNPNNAYALDVAESKFFQLDFADKNAFRCYLKGTSYYADGEWYKVSNDNILGKKLGLLDFTDLTVWEDAVSNLGYFVCVFDFIVPAGRYIATLGRHNVASSGDYRNTSTYILGIANSRVKTSNGANIGPNAINDNNGILYSKEMEIDCTSGDVDVWGNNHDLFYIFCPHIHATGHGKYRFIEGYIEESSNTHLPLELFPYRMVPSGAYALGHLTDKNGFYWAYTQIRESDDRRIEIHAKINCQYPYRFEIPTSGSGIGWKQNAIHYLSDHITVDEMPANRILLSGRITNLDGTLNYSNIAITIKDGATVYTNSGFFLLVIHNGQSVNRVSNVYVHGGGNFQISIANCGYVPLFNFNEALVPCYNPMPLGTVRAYPIALNLAVKVSSDSETSLKEGGKNSVGIVGADLAGRLMYVNIIDNVSIPSFAERGSVAATFFRVLIDQANFSDYPDIKWISFFVSKNTSIKRFIEWIGDEITFIDNNGRVVNDASSAVFASIKINSLFNYNISNSFSLLSTYEFVKGDRVRIFDNGEGIFFDYTNYGDPIDLRIEGTNYTQVALNAGMSPDANTVSPDAAIIVKYDNRLKRLLDKKGFWIQIYTPTEQSEIIPFYEVLGMYPVVNNAIAEFTGYSNGQPVHNYLAYIDLQFWDTYFFRRSINIPNVGSRFLGHIFQSQNVTDSWGADLISGGRPWIKNDNAKQYWLPGETAKSDNFLKEGILNGLATFRTGNKKDFGSFPYGAITAVHSERNIIVFICENDWFTTDYNFHRAFLNEQGILVANLDDGLSAPHQKIGSLLGMAKVDTGTVITYDKEIFWYDRKNTGYIKCNYRDAVDTTKKAGAEQGGMQSYMATKTDFITVWNNANARQKTFDVIAGIDKELGKVYLTFRCRRNNSNEDHSYINHRRNWQLNFQETIVYDTINNAWIRSEAFTPEGYGSVKGDATGMQLVSFAAGKPYLHNSEKNSFNKFYGVQTTPVIIGVLNEDKIEKVFDGIFYSGNPSGWFIDSIFTDFKNSFTYLSANKFKKYLNTYYAAIERNANSYPSNAPEDLFRSMFVDGYRSLGKYLVFRMVGDYAHLNEYKEVGLITGAVSMEDSNKK